MASNAIRSLPNSRIYVNLLSIPQPRFTEGIGYEPSSFDLAALSGARTPPEGARTPPELPIVEAMKRLVACMRFGWQVESVLM